MVGRTARELMQWLTYQHSYLKVTKSAVLVPKL